MINVAILKMRIEDVAEARRQREAAPSDAAALNVQYREQILAAHIMGIAPELLSLLTTNGEGAASGGVFICSASVGGGAGAAPPGAGFRTTAPDVFRCSECGFMEQTVEAVMLHKLCVHTIEDKG